MRNVSVAIATFNGASFIEEQLDSIAGQTLLPVEVVVSDDCSSDGTLKIVADFQRTAPFPMRVSRNEERQGFANNFYNSIKLCSGELIALSDQDDVWSSKKLSQCVQPFIDPEVVLAIHTAEVVDSQLKPTGRYFPRFQRAQCISPLQSQPLWVPPGFAMVFAKRLLGAGEWHTRPLSVVDVSGAQQTHDEWIYFLSRVTGNIVLLPDVLACYRQHDKNQAGVPKINVLNTVGKAFITGSGHYYDRAALAQQCAQYLNRMANVQQGFSSTRFFEAERNYSGMSNSFSARSVLYSLTKSKTRQLFHFLKMVVQGCYRPRNKSGLGISSLLKDILMVVKPNIG